MPEAHSGHGQWAGGQDLGWSPVTGSCSVDLGQGGTPAWDTLGHTSPNSDSISSEIISFIPLFGDDLLDAHYVNYLSSSKL